MDINPAFPPFSVTLTAFTRTQVEDLLTLLSLVPDMLSPGPVVPSKPAAPATWLITTPPDKEQAPDPPLDLAELGSHAAIGWQSYDYAKRQNLKEVRARLCKVRGVTVGSIAGREIFAMGRPALLAALYPDGSPAPVKEEPSLEPEVVEEWSYTYARFQGVRALRERYRKVREVSPTSLTWRKIGGMNRIELLAALYPDARPIS
jgi:hypothetical protein